MRDHGGGPGQRWMRNPAGKRSVALAVVLAVGWAGAASAERAAPSPSAPSQSAPAGPTGQVGTRSALPVKLDCSVTLKSSGLQGLPGTVEIKASNASTAAVPVRTRVMWTLSGKVASVQTSQDGKPQVSWTPSTSSGEFHLRESLGVGKTVTLASLPSSKGVTYGSCTAVAGP